MCKRETYKEIILKDSETENYELQNNNIVELIVLKGKEDISSNCKVDMYMSKEALIGFGINVIRLSESFDSRIHIHVDPLGNAYANQSMGFFLTPNSPALVVECSDEVHDFKRPRMSALKPIRKETQFDSKNFVFRVNLTPEDNEMEHYEIGFCNICEVNVFEHNIDISSEATIILKLSRNAMVGIGTQALRWAHYITEGIIYECLHEKTFVQQPTMGFWLNDNSASLRIQIQKMRSASEYSV